MPSVFLALLGGMAFAICQWLIYMYAPTERTMGVVQKIFYMHLPMALWGMISFFVVCIAGAAFLKTRKPAWDSVAGAAAELGVVLASLTLVTGSVWARHSWGTWWTWDPRLTTALVMWFLYVAYLVMRGQDMPRERKAFICAVFGIIAFLDVPLVFLSARLWYSIHPAVFAAEGGGLEPEMRFTALACVISFGFLWLALLLMRIRQIHQTERLIYLENKGKFDD